MLKQKIAASHKTLLEAIKKQDQEQEKSARIEHKVTTLFIFGLFAFVLKLESRREMNNKLTAPCIQAHLKKIFPDLETIPHADTLARFLEKTNPLEIEKAHMELIKALIAI